MLDGVSLIYTAPQGANYAIEVPGYTVAQTLTSADYLGVTGQACTSYEYDCAGNV